MLKSLALSGTAFVFLAGAGICLIGWTDRRGVYVHDGVELCKPHCTYSMCAIIRAHREVD
jgi:hypothetical protein